MIQFAKRAYSKEASLQALSPVMREWFIKKFGDLTPPQRFSFKLISRGKNVLITAPTGSGKTLSAFAAIISELSSMDLEDMVYCVYVSPLRALDNDIHKNLIEPLRELGLDDRIRVAVRTGDISANEKQKQLRKPPHILITTPESLAIILNSGKFIKKFSDIKWVVVDELHELAGSKRGVHLSLSLERLCDITGKDFIRIGLGATLHPLEEAARFLVGTDRDCTIVDVSWFKPFELKLLCPTDDIIGTDADVMSKKMYAMLEKEIKKHRTTLIFTNTRSGTERVVHNLASRFEEGAIAAHHGSLSREIRWDVEERLKEGKLKAVVCSTSLELGIDIGHIDYVIQIGSPKSVTRCVQRMGRSGHNVKDRARGAIIALDRDDVVECAIMLRCIKEHFLDSFKVPENCLDMLAQHVVGMSLTRKWKVEEALSVIRGSYCYKNLKREDFEALLHYLAGHYASLEDRNVYGKIWFEGEEFGRRGKYTRVIYYLNIGAIPDEVKVSVYTVKPKRFIGNVEEEFLERLRKGDVFVLGGNTYEFRYARGMTCFVEERPDESPTIPAWFSEMLPLSYELALEIGEFRENAERALMDRKDIKIKTLQVDKNSEKAIRDYFSLQWVYARSIPTHRKIIVEETKDMKGRKAFVFHALFGRRVNDCLSRALGFIITRALRSDAMLSINDNGFALILAEERPIDFEKVFEELYATDMESLLKENIRKTELMKRRFRHNASRSFLVLRNYKGYRLSVRRQQISAQTLLGIVEKIDPQFPVIKETYREILYDLMDMEKAKGIVEALKKGDITWELIETDVPSPFAQNLIVLGEPDIILMKDRKERLLEMHRALLERISENETKRS
jgi:ATP-dependent Lhr-like helicase